MEQPPKEPTAGDFEWAQKMRERLKAWLHVGRARADFPFERVAHEISRTHDYLDARDVSLACRSVKNWVEFQRRREARRMSEDELRAFRQHLTWTPRTAVWKAFSAFMADRNGEWKMRLATHLGAYDAAQAAMRGQGTAEFLEAADEARRLCAELPDEWDPRPVERFPRGIPPERHTLWKATPFRRYVG
jgi:hypothetical protein